MRAPAAAPGTPKLKKTESLEEVAAGFSAAVPAACAAKSKVRVAQAAATVTVASGSTVTVGSPEGADVKRKGRGEGGEEKRRGRRGDGARRSST